MKKPKAIGYVCDIPIPETDLVISREDQRSRILRYAEDKGIELVDIYEDEEFTEPFVNRPGIQRIINCRDNIEIFLVERVWSLSRKMNELTPFLEKLYKKNIQLETSSYLWDCTSQQVRHHHLVQKLRKAKTEAKKEKEAA